MSQSKSKFRYVVANGCVFCGGCQSECPVGAAKITNAGATIDAQKCIGCGKCLDHCAAEAIRRVEVKES